MKFFLKLASIAAIQVKKYGAQYRTFALFTIIAYPLSYLYEVYSNNLTTNLWIRLIPVILCLVMLFKEKWPEKLKKFIPLFWYLTVMISIPTLGSYMLLKNSFSFEWLNNFYLGIVTMLCLLDIKSFLVTEFVGLSLGVMVFHFSGNAVYYFPDQKYFSIFCYVLLHMIILGAIFTRNKEIYNDYLQRSKDELNIHLEQKVRERTQELECALSAKTEFLNNMSHEIRTPVTGFLNISEGLVDHWNKLEETKRFSYAKDIASAANRLASLIGNLLDLAKFSSGKMILDIFEMDLKIAIEAMIDECHALYLSNKKIELEFVNNAVDPNFMGDCERIAQVLRNLFYNAIKFSSENSIITITIKNTKINDNNRGKPTNGLYFAIADQGVGIPHDELAVIFEPFTQSTRTKTRAGGTGLGLAIVKEIIEAHHGKIWAENNEDNGATFHFIIPMDHDEKREGREVGVVNSVKYVASDNNLTNKIADSSQNLEPIEEDQTEKPTILMIDDEEFLLDSMKLQFSNSKYRLVCAVGGIAGLEYLEKHGDKVDLILLDLMMPDMYGLNVLTHIKQNPKTSHIPVILQSGTSDMYEIRKAYEFGVIGNLKKPYKAKSAMILIDKKLEKHKL